MTSSISKDWAKRFGLADTPLYEQGELPHAEKHTVLLNGGSGSFILSDSSDLDARVAAGWAWSSGLPHHVSISNENVTVTRWDAPESAEQFTLRSVNDRLDAFYTYLTKRRTSGRKDVVATLLDLFRSVRGEVRQLKGTDEASIGEFLLILARLMAEERQGYNIEEEFLQSWQKEILGRQPVLTDNQFGRIEAGFRHQTKALLDLSLSTTLAVRHAASAIFQEAHFAFQTAQQADLFAYQPATSTRAVSRGTQHFTPPSLARTVVEMALASMADLRNRQELVVCDPACGSGAFLTEAIRTLRRLGYSGSLKIVGRDISGPAIDMARFALHAAKFDWQPNGGISLDLAVADALEDQAIPACDLVVMNPPFLAWSMMTRDQREKASDVLGNEARHRPDLSMCFVTRALAALNEQGVIASLLPASILMLDSAKNWRDNLLQSANLAFLGSFGEYGLFAHAVVQVAAVVLVKGKLAAPPIALRSENEAAATSEALRALRKIKPPIVTGLSGRGWRVSPLDSDSLAITGKWRILPEKVETALRRLDEIGMPRIGDIFDVRQGLLTGLNDAFVLTEKEFGELPEEERAVFRPAIFRDAISQGTVRERYFVFFPYSKEGLIFSSEQELSERLPAFFSKYLLPRRDALESRSGIGADRAPWWALSRYYTWAQRADSRIVTKYFGQSGDIAVDLEAHFVPLQGYAWFIKAGRGADRAKGSFSGPLLMAYASLLNSRAFTALLNLNSDAVKGGQFNLSGRFVKPIPLPDLSTADTAPIMRELEALWRATDRLSPSWHAELDIISQRAWGADLTEALLETVDA